MNKQALTILIILGLGAASGWAVLRPTSHGAQEDHDHDEDGGHAQEPAEDIERGPHGGRMLRDGSFSVELQIFEDNRPPEFRLFAYQDDRPLPAERVTATVDLTRLGGHQDRFEFVPRGSYLEGQGVVAEPHSFDVTVRAAAAGHEHSWSYASYEARAEISAEAARAAGVMVAQAGPALISEFLLLYGSIIADERRVRVVAARFPGVVREVRKNLGEQVSHDDILAIVESNESLQTYPIRSPISGVVTSRKVNPGENVADQPLFTIADLTSVWAELAVFRRDLSRVRIGQRVRVRSDDGGVESQGAVMFISPLGSGESQSVKLRVALENRDGRWRPGIFVVGDVEVAATEVPVAVARSGLQTYREFDVVFANVDEFYEPRMLEIGHRGRDFVEVKSGIRAGDRYVIANSFLLKADIGKSGASHDH